MGLPSCTTPIPYPALTSANIPACVCSCAQHQVLSVVNLVDQACMMVNPAQWQGIIYKVCTQAQLHGKGVLALFREYHDCTRLTTTAFRTGYKKTICTKLRNDCSMGQKPGPYRAVIALARLLC